MAIVCGTDFSDHATHASRVAAAFARALGEPLVLVHVVDLVALGWVDPSIATRCSEMATERLADLARRLAGDGLQIETCARVGTPEEELASVAEERSARLIVVGVLGYRSEERWRVGSLAGRLARGAPTPVLLVADAAPFEQCARGERPLRVLTAADLSLSSDAALEWLGTLRRLGACDATLLHVYDPTREHARLGLRGPVPIEGEARVESVLLRDLQARIGDVPGPGHTEIQLMASLDWIAESVASVAEQDRYDLVLVGGRRRSGLARIRHDSVSEALLRLAPGSVLRVPVLDVEPRKQGIPRLARVLAPTDLSEFGSSAVRYAYALAPPGGTVVLLHVVEKEPMPNPLYAHYASGQRPTPEQRAEQSRQIEALLARLVPEEAEWRGIETRIEVVQEGEPAEAIRGAAERLAVDAICMASHGRSGLSRLIAGSVAQEVAGSSRRPVFLVRPPAER